MTADRHSRVSGNPEVVGRQRTGLFSTVGIPAYAGMTVGGRQHRSNQMQESCLSCLSCLSMFESVSPLVGKDGNGV